MKRLAYVCGAALCLLVGCQQTTKIETTSSAIQQPTAYIEFEQHYPMLLADGSTKDVTEHIKMAKVPSKIVVLDMPTLDSLYAVNIYHQIQGIRADDDILRHLPESLRKEFSKQQYVSVGNAEHINFNMIKKLSPEVIFIGHKEATESTIQQLRQAAPNAKIIYTGINEQDYLASLRQQSQLLGNIFNKSQLYETYLKNIDLDVDYIKNFDKQNVKLAIIDVNGYNISLTTDYNEWLAQLGLGEHIYLPATKEETSIDMQVEEVDNQRIMLARESATEPDSIVAQRQQQIDKEKHVPLNFDKNIASYQPTAIIFIDDVIEENHSNMPTILFSEYMKSLSAVQADHYRTVYATEWKGVRGGIYSFYTQVEDVVKTLQKIKK